MKKLILGLIIGLLILPICIVIYFFTGMVPVATADAPMPMEKTVTGFLLNSKVTKEAPKNVPFTPDEQVYIAGAHIYRENCAVCHGLPGQEKATAIATGMFPKPPQLFTHGVTDDPAGDTYWKVANGIRLTGMPGFKSSLSEPQMWQVSLFLANADKLPPSAIQALSASENVSPVPQATNPTPAPVAIMPPNKK